MVDIRMKKRNAMINTLEEKMRAAETYLETIRMHTRQYRHCKACFTIIGENGKGNKIGG